MINKKLINQIGNKLKIGVYFIFFLNYKNLSAQKKNVLLSNFNSVVVSPHIQVTFIKADYESLIVDESKINQNKIKTEIKNNVLYVFLEDEKVEVDFEKNISINWDEKKSRYKGNIVKISLNYNKIERIALVGNEKFVFKNSIESSNFLLNIFGKCKLLFEKVKIEDFIFNAFGKNSLEIKSGEIFNKKITVFGENKIIAPLVDNFNINLKSTGENFLKLRVNKKISIDLIGRCTLSYWGNPVLDKNMTLGDLILIKNEN